MDSYQELVNHRVIKPFLARVFTVEDLLTNSYVQSRSPSGSLYVVKKLDLSRLEKGIFKFKLLCTDTQRLIVVLVSKSLSSDRGLTKIEVGYVLTPCKFLLARCSAGKTCNGQPDLTVCLYLTKLELIHSPCIPVNLFGQRSIFHHLTHTLLTCDPLIPSSQVDKLMNLSSSGYLSFDPAVMNERELDCVVAENQISLTSATVTCRTLNINTTANTGATIHCDNEIDVSSLQVKASHQNPSRILEDCHRSRVNEASSARRTTRLKTVAQSKQVNLRASKSSNMKPLKGDTCPYEYSYVQEVGFVGSVGQEKHSEDDCLYLGTFPNYGVISNDNGPKRVSTSSGKASDETAMSSNDFVGSNFAMVLPPNKTRDSLEAELSGTSSGKPWSSLDSGDKKCSPVKLENQKVTPDINYKATQDGKQPVNDAAESKSSETCRPEAKAGTGKISKHRAPYDRAKAAKRLKSLINSSPDCHKLLCCVDI